MNEVRLDLVQYDDLNNRIRTKTERINALEQELSKLKEDHEAEIDKLVKEGKVRVVTKTRPFSFFAILEGHAEPSVSYKGFDEIKAEVEEHFKQGLFNEELEKEKQNQLNGLVKQIAEKDTAISDLKAEIERLKSRSLWERIMNKF